MIIIPANTLSTGGYEVDNSVRLNSPSADYLNHTNGTPTSDKKYTFSTWVKRSKLSHRGQFLRVINPSSTAYYTFLEFSSDDRLGFNDYNGTSTNFQTDDLFRDVSAWYHFVIAIDTTQATESNRLKLYINGVQKTTGFSTGINYPSLNKTIIATSSGRDINIGGDPVGSGATRKFDGYMAEVVFIDGQQLTPTSFGEFDEDSGIWKPIDVSGLTFGTNGFYLDFEDSAALGDDVSGNGNDFTVNNLTAIDQSTDTCTNNFATLNPLNAYNSTTIASLSEGNLKISGTASDGGISSTIGVSTGKWYWETKYTTQVGGDPVVGIINSYGANRIKYTNSGSVTSGSGVWCMFNLTSGGVGFQEDGVFVSYPSSTLADGDILNIAIDVDAQKLWYGKNGVWYNSGNPATGTNAVSTNLTANETWFAYCEKRNSSSVWETNFGSPPYTISSGNTDGNGYGNFEYAVPSGYYSLNTKNLSEFG